MSADGKVDHSETTKGQKYPKMLKILKIAQKKKVSKYEKNYLAV